MRAWLYGLLLGLVVWGLGLSGTSLAYDARPAPLPITAYGVEPRIDMIALSPSGELIARVEALEGGRALVVSRLADGHLVVATRIGEAKVRYLRFVGEDRLLIETSQTMGLADLGVRRSEFFFGILLDLKTQKTVQVLERTPDVLPTPYGPISVVYSAQGPKILARGFDIRTGRASLHRVEPTSGRGRSIQRMDTVTEDYVLDTEGEPMAMADYEERTGRWALRLASDWLFKENWVTHALLDPPVLRGRGRTEGTVLVAAIRPDLVPTEAESETGYQIFEVDVASGAWTWLPFNPYPHHLAFHPETRLLIGTGQIEEKGVRYSFTDPLADRRWRAIERAFPDQYPALATWSHDFSRVLVYLDNRDAGHYQLVDFSTGRAELAGEAYPALTQDHLGGVRHLTYAAADGLEIPAYVTMPPGVSEPKGLPLVVMPHGGPASRDRAGFDYWAQAVASRGYVVLQPNFRGSTGYGRAFLEAGYGEWGRKMQTDLSDGVRHLTKLGWVDPARVCIVGGSYGGYAAMAGLALDGEVYRCGISINGVSDLRRMLQSEVRDTGSSKNYTIRYWSRFMGGSGAGDRGLDAYSPVYLAAQFKAPLLLIHGKDDTVVRIEQSRVMAEALRREGRPVELIELEGEDHWLSRVETRQAMLTALERFLLRHNPPDEEFRSR